MIGQIQKLRHRTLKRIANVPFIVCRGAMLCLPFIFLNACSQQDAAPKPVAIESAPTSFAEAFKNAKPEAKQLATEATAALESKDYARALLALQSLAGRSDLTDSQRDMASRSMLSVNQALTEQAASGNQQAQQVLQLRRTTK